MARYSIKKCRDHSPVGAGNCRYWLVLDRGQLVSEHPSWRDAFRAVQQRQGRDAFVPSARRNWQLPATKRWRDG